MTTDEELVNAAEELMIFLEQVEGAAYSCRKKLESIFGTVSGQKPAVAKPKKEDESLPFDMANINWVEEHGSKGPYEKAYPEHNTENPAFAAMRGYMEKQEKKGKFIKPYWCWLFDNGCIGRKDKRKKAAQ